MTTIEKKAVVIGIVTVITIIISVLGYEYMKGNNPFKADRYFYAVYDDVIGLSETAPVKINGVPVGQVTKISFDPQTAKVIVQFIVEEKDVKIPYGSIAQIYSADMLGTKAMKIILGHGNRYYQDGDTIQSALEQQLTDVLSQKMDKLDQLVQNSVNITAKIDSFISDDLVEDLTLTIQTLKHTITVIDTSLGTGSQLQKSLANLKKLTASLASQSQNINQIIENTKSLTDTLAALKLQQSLATLDSSLIAVNALLDKINSGQGTVGQLIVNDTLYQNLDSLIANLNAISEKIKQNPSKAVDLSIIKIEKNRK